MKNNKLLQFIKTALPHLSIVFSIYFIIMVILNDYNPTINLLANPLNVTGLTVFCLINLLNAFFILQQKISVENKADNEVQEALTAEKQ